MRTAEISSVGQPACQGTSAMVSEELAQDPAYRPTHPLYSALTWDEVVLKSRFMSRKYATVNRCFRSRALGIPTYHVELWQSR
jgi:hypothetical protein